MIDTMDPDLVDGWTEHGGGVSGAWLTDKGRAVLAALRAATRATDSPAR